MAEIREQRPRVTDVEWLQFHCCRWGVGSARWLPPGAWSACRAVYEVGDEPLVLGVDIGGSRSASSVVGCVAREDGRVDVGLVEVWQGADEGSDSHLDLIPAVQTPGLRSIRRHLDGRYATAAP